LRRVAQSFFATALVNGFNHNRVATIGYSNIRHKIVVIYFLFAKIWVVFNVARWQIN
jgi:hypothetical protein